MDDRDEYSVYQFFPDDSCERVVSFVSPEKAVHMAQRLTETVGARLGTTRRIIITDGGDYCVFEWKHGEGITFPPRSTIWPEEER